MKLETKEVLLQGLIAGLIAYASVVLFFLIVNVLAGRSPFYTPAALGSVLFYGVREPGAVLVEPGPVLAYNGLHLALSWIVGTIAAFLVFETERHHAMWYLFVFTLMAGFIYTVVAVGAIGAEIARVIPWWTVVGSNLAWVLGVGGYLGWIHRGLLRDLRREQATGAED